MSSSRSVRMGMLLVTNVLIIPVTFSSIRNMSSESRSLEPDMKTNSKMGIKMCKKRMRNRMMSGLVVIGCLLGNEHVDNALTKNGEYRVKEIGESERFKKIVVRHLSEGETVGSYVRKEYVNFLMISKFTISESGDQSNRALNMLSEYVE